METKGAVKLMKIKSLGYKLHTKKLKICLGNRENANLDSILVSNLHYAVYK